MIVERQMLVKLQCELRVCGCIKCVHY